MNTFMFVSIYAESSLLSVVSTDLANGIGNFFLSVLGLLAWIAIIIVIVALGFVLNSSHKKLYGVGTALSFIPVANGYIATKIAFGEDFASRYVYALVISVPLYFIKYLRFISSLINAVAFVAIAIVVIRWVKKEFNFDAFEIKDEKTNVNNTVDSIDNNGEEDNNVESVNNEDVQVDNDDANDDEITDEEVEEAMSDDTTEEDDEAVLNLDYSSGSLKATVNDEDTTDRKKSNEVSEDKSAPEGESDLMNLYK